MKNCIAMQYNSGTKVHTAYWEYTVKQYMINDQCSEYVLHKYKHLETKSLEELFNTYHKLHKQWATRKANKLIKNNHTNNLALPV